MSLLPPNLFLLGAPKAGTSAVADVLRKHPQVYCEKKEPRFFDAHVFHDDPAFYPYKSLNQYLSLFDNTAAQNASYRLDASTFVMYDDSAVRKILEISPNSRFVVMLRDPIDASRSMHRQRLRYSDKKLREVSDDFMTCWNQLQARAKGESFPAGCRNKILFQYDRLYHYECYIPKIIAAVGSNPFLILNYQELRTDPKGVFQKLANFLELDPLQFPASQEVNTSTYVGNTLRNRVRQTLFRFVARNTRNLRISLGLVGYKLKPKKRKQSQTVPPSQGEFQFDVLTNEFRDTYQFLEKLFEDTEVKRNEPS